MQSAGDKVSTKSSGFSEEVLKRGVGRKIKEPWVLSCFIPEKGGREGGRNLWVLAARIQKNSSAKKVAGKANQTRAKIILETTAHLGPAGNPIASASLSPRTDGFPPHSLPHPNPSKSRILHSPTCLNLVHHLGLENRRRVTDVSHLSAPLIPVACPSTSLTSWPAVWLQQTWQWLYP